MTGLYYNIIYYMCTHTNITLAFTLCADHSGTLFNFSEFSGASDGEEIFPYYLGNAGTFRSSLGSFVLSGSFTLPLQTVQDAVPPGCL